MGAAIGMENVREDWRLRVGLARDEGGEEREATKGLGGGEGDIGVGSGGHTKGGMSWTGPSSEESIPPPVRWTGDNCDEGVSEVDGVTCEG